jgi:hypothetical protein
MLSGFQKVGERMKVYLAIPAKDPKDTAYLALQAGEKERDVEIVKIRADKQEVDILNTGTPMTLTIASNGFPLSGGGAVAKAGGPPPPGTPEIRRMPGFRGAPPPNMPAAAVPSPASRSGSAIIVGGGSGSSGGPQSYGSSSYGGAIVSGGNSAPVNTTAAVPNNPAAQIANTLFSGGATGQGYRMPAPENVAPAPRNC